MKTPIVSVPSVNNSYIASNISYPGRNQICIQKLDDDSLNDQNDLSTNIEFENDESVKSIKWIRLENNTNNSTPSKKRRNSNSTLNTDSNSNSKFLDYLVILLETGEILIYSILTKEFVNKISTDYPFSVIEVINKVGYSKNSLYNYDYDLIAFDSNSLSLKLFSSSSPQLINSIPFKEDPNISFILFNSNILKNNKSENIELILASDKFIYLLNKNHEIVQTIDIKLNSSNDSNSKTASIKKIIKRDSLLYIIRTDCSNIQIIDINDNDNNNNNSNILTSSNNITDITLLKSNNSNIISATLIDGTIELFKIDDNAKNKFAKLEIDGGNDIGKFICLLNSNGNGIIEGVFKGIWYDNFNIKITDFEFEDITKLNGTIQINVSELEDPKDEFLNLIDSGDEEVEVDNTNNDDDEREEINEIVISNEKIKDFTCQELSQIIELIKERLLNKKNDEYDIKLSYILSQNTTFAKSAIYLLSIDESILLFNKISFIITHYQTELINQDFEFLSNIKTWLKWLIVLRGSVITTDEESIGWLKLLQSEFKQESNSLNGMIKLTGKLSLLKDQLNVRKEMMKKNESDNELGNGMGVEDEDDVNNSDEEDGTTIIGDSVVLDGEGGFEELEED